MQCVEEEGMLKPFTRDTFSSCIKATYCEVDGKSIPIFKDPKDGGFKKSQKGLCRVFRDTNGNITYQDGFTSETIVGENMLQTVFKDGKLLREQTLAELRDRLNDGNF